MHRSLTVYVNTQCDLWWSARIKVKDFVDGFRASLPERERAHWERWRIVDELTQAGFEIGVDTDKCAYIAGIGARGVWRVKAGRLWLDILSADKRRGKRQYVTE